MQMKITKLKKKCKLAIVIIKSFFRKILLFVKNKTIHIAKYIWNFIKDYFRTLFPDYSKIRRDAGIGDDRVEEIKKEEDKIRSKYFIYEGILLLLLFIMGNSIRKVIAKNITPPVTVLYLNLQMWGLFIGLIGTILLAKGFVRNRDQLALESATN